MKSLLSRAGYVFDPNNEVWRRSAFDGINYSDGDEIELRIESIVRNAVDISSLSVELEGKCTDWASFYHLSKARANILRPFRSDLAGDVLEIGAGCGAITRYLGECGANVLALEGSIRRATIARQRTRDLSNVTVVAETFDKFETTERFDAITLIGVLEYAGIFVSGDNPTLQMLSRVKSLLKPGGKLYIAIENQLGLKYFAGAPEDHIGRAMYGVEGRYRPGEPRTFGRKDLAAALTDAGFKEAHFLAPFPDYKLPVSIVSETAFDRSDFDASVFAVQTVPADPQLPPVLGFSPELVWPNVARNGLGMDLANSFLVVATDEHLATKDKTPLVWHYTTGRKREFCKETTFVEADDGHIEVRYFMLDGNATRCSTGEWLRLHLPEKSTYVRGTLMSEELVRVVASETWTTEQLADVLDKYLRILMLYSEPNTSSAAIVPPNHEFPGTYFDRIPQNMVVDSVGSPRLIDEEWELRQPVQAGFVVYRALVNLLASVSRIGRCESIVDMSRYEIIKSTMRALGWNITDVDIRGYVELESRIQCEVTGASSKLNQAWEWLVHTPVATENLAIQNTRLQAELASSEDALQSSLDTNLGLEKDVKLLERQRAELHSALDGVYASSSWKITAPARFIAGKLRLGKRVLKLVPALLSRSGGVGGAAKKGLRILRTEGLTGIRGRLRMLERMQLTSRANASQHSLGERARVDYNIVPYYVDPKLDTALPGNMADISVGVHLYLADISMLEEYARYLANIPGTFDLFVSVNECTNLHTIKARLGEVLPSAGDIVVEAVPQRGSDFAPLIAQFGERLLAYSIVGHFHAVGTLDGNRKQSNLWHSVEQLLGAPGTTGARVTHYFHLLEGTTKFIYTDHFELRERDTTGWGGYLETAKAILDRYTTISAGDFHTVEFPASSMFWARRDSLKPLLDLPVKFEDFSSEITNSGSALEHALRRLVFVLSFELPGRCLKITSRDSVTDYLDYESRQDFRDSIVHKDIKVLAFYLPQFHPTPENDEWHGEGFTEWTKVRAANPLFDGHYQQHIPHPDIGYYLLDTPETLRMQADLMSSAGVSGLVFYHYWFGGRLILEKPAQMLLDNPDINLPYCFCWANENWTKRWDGNENEVLLAQNYSAQDARDFIHYLIPYFRDPRYLTVDDRPILMVYRPNHIDDVHMYIDIWTRECRSAGLREPYIVAVLTRGTSDPRDVGMDAGVERVLHDWTAGGVPEIKGTLRHYNSINGSVISYDDVADFYAAQAEPKDFTYFRSIVPIWDNTARYGAEAYVVHGSSPQKYQEWLSTLIEYSKQTLPEDRRFILVNAWNEWAEGAHLEPDTRYGYAYLNATGRALSGLPFASYPLASPEQRYRNVHFNFSDDFWAAVEADPILGQRFVHTLRRSTILSKLNVSISGEKAEELLPELSRHEGDAIDLVIEFRSPSFFSPEALERMIFTVSREPDSVIIPNYYDGKSELINVTCNRSVDPAAMAASPILLYRPGLAAKGFGNVRMCTTASCFVTEPDTIEAADLDEVTTIIRVHKSANLELLRHAICCLAAMRNCACVPLIAAQDLSERQLDAVRKMLDDYLWKGKRQPAIREYYTQDGTGDLRARMLNESLRSVETRYVALLDYDDLLMLHAYDWLLSRLRLTGKAVAFGRVYATSYVNATNLKIKRQKAFEYGYSYDEFVMHNHAPLHSFLLDLSQLDVKNAVYYDDQRYMEDYLLTLQLFSEENADWDGLAQNVYIGDYLHSVDRQHTLAFSGEDERDTTLNDPLYQLCSARIRTVQQRLLTKKTG